jgi:hypothetical protein
VTRDGARLFADIPRNYRSEVFPESESKFFLKTYPIQITFEKNGRQATDLDWVQGGETWHAKRIK